MYNYGYNNYYNRQDVPECPFGQIYTAEVGDTIYGIAQKFEISPGSILDVNPGLSPENLQIGQKICVPIPKCPNGQIITVEAGDTIYGIANRYNLSVVELLAANPGVDPDMLFIGQKICLPKKVSEECPGQFYMIKAGDTIYRLARRYGFSVDEILKANPGLDPDRLFIGQKICLPKKVIEECPGQLYTIKAGDNFYKLAQKFEVSVDAIQAANPGVNPNALQIGQKVCVPSSTVKCPDGEVYVIKPGDNLYKLAKKYNISLEELLKLNPQIKNPDNLSVGENICVPSSS